ncbi:MAG TPA: peptide ABC transporter substrate-binding protein [Ruminiclostridium sp.]
MKKVLRVISLIIIIGILLSACTVNLKRKTDVVEAPYADKYDVIDKGPVKGGSVRLFTTPIDTLNPIITNNIYVQDFLGLVFEGLYRLDSTGQPIPVLAKSSSISADGLSLTVLLINDIKWQDKMPLKAEDIVFTINTIMDAKNNSVYIKNVQNIASVAASDNNTVVIKLKKPYSFIKNELTFPIIPMHHFLNENIKDKKSKVNLLPIGTGPYSFASYNSKTGIKLKLNEQWWNSAKDNNETDTSTTPGTKTTISAIPLPYIPTVEIKIFQNSNDANAAFQTGSIDVIPAEYGEFRKYIGRTDITMKRYIGKNYEFLSMNLKKGPLADKRVRNALNDFINKKQLVDTAASGIAVPAEIPVPPNSWIYQLTSLQQSNDLKKAKGLMTQSGYILDTNMNKYVKKYTKKALTLKLIVNDDNILRLSVANEIASQLGKIGITVVVSRVPWADVQKNISSGAYDMAILGYRISSIPDLSFAYATAEISSGLNVAKYSNPTVDSYLQQILTQNNSETQKSMYINLLKIILEDRPYIGLFFLNESVMYSKNIRGAINPYVGNKYNDISQWYIP